MNKKKAKIQPHNYIRELRNPKTLSKEEKHRLDVKMANRAKKKDKEKEKEEKGGKGKKGK